MEVWNKINYKVNKDGREYVGINIKENSVSIHLPVGYNYNEEDKEKMEFKNEIKKLMILTGKKYHKYSDAQEDNENSFDFISAIKVVNDYKNYGLYKQSEKKSKINYKGKINWQKTINQKQLYINGKTIYNNIVNEYIDYKCEKEIQEIQKYCLYEISRTIGFLLDFKYGKSIRKYNKQEIIDIINKELKTTNEDIKNQMLNNLNQFIINTNLRNLEKRNISITNKEFMYVFQKLIDIYGIKGSEKEKYNPRALYCYWNSNEIKEWKNPLLPDTIINDKGQFKEYKDMVFLLDAKYKRIESLPEEYDIIKQIRYEVYIKEEFRKMGENKKIINAFILPNTLPEEEIKITNFYARLEESSSPEKIFVVYVDMKLLILETERIMKKLLEKLIEAYEKYT